MKTGGWFGHYEFFEKMTNRLFSFRHKFLGSIDQNELKKIYGEKFLNRAKEICLKYKRKPFSPETLLTEIVQFDVIVILPGQELSMHLGNFLFVFYFVLGMFIFIKANFCAFKIFHIFGEQVINKYIFFKSMNVNSFVTSHDIKKL